MPRRSAGATLLTRRELLRCGLGGSLALGAVSLSASLAGCATAPASPPVDTPADSHGFRFLSEDDRTLWAALLPVILGSNLSADPAVRRLEVDTVTRRIDGAIAHFSDNKQAEVRQLFDLLNFSLTRGMVTGIWRGWDTASPQAVDEFLEDWRLSSMGVLNQGYAALVQLAGASYFSHPDQWAQAHYPGPPDWAVQALPQFNAG